MEIQYKVNHPITAEQAIDIYVRSTLGERRPVNRPDIFQKMLDHADLLITAWDGDLLIGVARTLTDFAYCAYLADLAVDVTYQKQGIGKRLIELTAENLEPTAYITLLAAPKATEYYPKVGFEHHSSAWMMRLR